MEEFVVGICIVDVGLALAHVVQNNRSERNRLKVLSLKFHVRHDALPSHRFVNVRQPGWQVIDEVAQVIEDGTALIDLHAMEQRPPCITMMSAPASTSAYGPTSSANRSGRAVPASLARRSAAYRRGCSSDRTRATRRREPRRDYSSCRRRLPRIQVQSGRR